MILRCKCGEKYSLKDEPVRLGASFPCKECGSEIPVPGLHGILSEGDDEGAPLEFEVETTSEPSSEPVSSLQERVEDLASINAALTVRTSELERQLAVSVGVDSGANPNKQLEERNHKITQLEEDLVTTRKEIAALVVDREAKLNERDFRLSEHSSDINRAWEDMNKVVAERDEAFKQGHKEIARLKSELSSTRSELDGEQAKRRLEARESDERYATLERDFKYSQDQVVKITAERDQGVSDRDERIAVLKHDLTTTQDEILSLVTNRDEQVKERETRISSLEAALEDMRSDMIASSSARDDRFKKFENQIGQLESRLRSATEELEIARSSSLGQTSQIQQAEQVTADRDEQIAALHRTISAYDDNVEFSNMQKTTILAMSGSVEKDLKVLTQTIAELMRRVEGMESSESEVGSADEPVGDLSDDGQKGELAAQTTTFLAD